MNLEKLLLCIFMISIVSGCDCAPWGYTKIGVINSSPAGFEGKQLKLKGVVTDVIKIPLVDVKMYTLNDGTGDITVVSNGGLPSLNGKISLKGKVESMAVIGNHAVGIRFLEEKRYD